MKQLRRRRLLIATGSTLLIPSVASGQANRVARIGWLDLGGTGASPNPVSVDGFRSGLRERGWREGENLFIEARTGDRAKSGELAADLLKANVELIVAPAGMVFGARRTAGTTPIVFSINGDPVIAKLVASYARPGGTMTGITALSAELSGKRLEFLRESVPGATRFAAIANQAHAGVEVESEATREAAQRLGISVKWFPVYKVDDFPAALDAIARDGVQALVAVPDNLMNHQAKVIAEFAAKHRVPTISGWAEFVEAGNLMSYGPSLRGFHRHLALYVDKILRGAKPAELPIERPTVFEFVVNKKTADALGIKIPQSVLVRADRVIE